MLICRSRRHTLFLQRQYAHFDSSLVRIPDGYACTAVWITIIGGKDPISILYEISIPFEEKTLLVVVADIDDFI